MGCGASAALVVMETPPPPKQRVLPEAPPQVQESSHDVSESPIPQSTSPPPPRLPDLPADTIALMTEFLFRPSDIFSLALSSKSVHQSVLLDPEIAMYACPNVQFTISWETRSVFSELFENPSTEDFVLPFVHRVILSALHPRSYYRFLRHLPNVTDIALNAPVAIQHPWPDLFNHRPSGVSLRLCELTARVCSTVLPPKSRAEVVEWLSCAIGDRLQSLDLSLFSENLYDESDWDGEEEGEGEGEEEAGEGGERGAARLRQVDLLRRIVVGFPKLKEVVLDPEPPFRLPADFWKSQSSSLVHLRKLCCPSLRCTSQNLVEMFQAAPNLSHLDVIFDLGDDPSEDHDDDLAVVACEGRRKEVLSTSLQSLNLAENPSLTLCGCMERFPSLRSLSNLCSLYGEVVTPVNASTLRSFTVGSAEQLLLSDIRILLEDAPNLRELVVEEATVKCVAATDMHLLSTAPGAKSLRLLIVESCQQQADMLILGFLSSFPELVFLRFSVRAPLDCYSDDVEEEEEEGRTLEEDEEKSEEEEDEPNTVRLPVPVLEGTTITLRSLEIETGVSPSVVTEILSCAPSLHGFRYQGLPTDTLKLTGVQAALCRNPTPELRVLDLTRTGNEEWWSYFDTLPLEELSIEDCDGTVDSLEYPLREIGPNDRMTTICLHKVKVTAAHVVSLLNSTPNLKDLWLLSCKLLQCDPGLATLSVNRRLKRLVVSNSNLLLGGLVDFLSAFPHLEVIHTEKIGLQGEDLISETDRLPSCKRLRELELREDSIGIQATRVLLLVYGSSLTRLKVDGWKAAGDLSQLHGTDDLRSLHVTQEGSFLPPEGLLSWLQRFLTECPRLFELRLVLKILHHSQMKPWKRFLCLVRSDLNRIDPFVLELDCEYS